MRIHNRLQQLALSIVATGLINSALAGAIGAIIAAFINLH